MRKTIHPERRIKSLHKSKPLTAKQKLLIKCAPAMVVHGD